MNTSEAEHIRWQAIVAKYAKPNLVMGIDDLESAVLVLDHTCTIGPRSGLSDADLYYLPRLWTWVFLQVTESQ